MNGIDINRDEKVVEALLNAKSCIIADDLKCVKHALDRASESEDCSVCRKEIKEFKKQVRHLPKEKRVEKVDLFLEVAEPAASIAHKIHRIREIKPEEERRKARFKILRNLEGKFRKLSKLKFWKR